MMKKKVNSLKRFATAALVAVSMLTVTVVQAEAAGITDGVIVQKGQTLSELASQYGTSVQTWKAVNQLDSDLIYAGQKLHISFPYKVTTGDQLGYLAERYETTVEQIQKINSMQSDLLYAGETIIIPAGMTGKPKVTVQPVTKPAIPTPAAQAPVAKPKPQPVAPTVAGMAYSKAINMTATAYGPANVMSEWGGYTYSGTKVRPGVIAVDPKVIPLGTKVYVTGYNTPLLPAGGFVATAEDTGGAIKGNRIDIYIEGTQAQLNQFGMQNVKLYVLK
ncbi:3D domain-containing protein [Tumebacillus lipolyticus]|uniref:LysM peptidoglycan-binding domain-containing protein n=1 Tax=Tumebacillus lipolyticus TaxID=1280370 RepID=A0ABW5A182_9BACL